MPPDSSRPPAIMERETLDALIAAIRERGFVAIGPRIRDGAIVYTEISGAKDLPIGWTDTQAPGSYRLVRRADEAVFSFAAGPHSAKNYLHPARLRLWSARRSADGTVAIRSNGDAARKLALIGVRSCDLHAIAIQNKVLAEGPCPDPFYASQRQNLLLIAVNCGSPAATCFCESMGTGPRVTGGYDLALTELLDAGSHRFMAEVGSPAGAALLDHLPHREATAAEIDAAYAVSEKTRRQLSRRIESAGLKDLLYANRENPRWDDIAARCLGCGNCTMVCPTCFCTTVEDRIDLAGTEAERIRTWDSCFSADFSHIHGGSVRASIKSRYRQWMTHKLGAWIDQFGASGCVGCGRCIAWCPVGIDITEEAAALRERDLRANRHSGKIHGRPATHSP